MHSQSFASQPADPIPPEAAQETQASWPPLRTDLQFHRAKESDAHNETWLLYDPLRGQYLELGELELLVLQLWDCGSAEKVAAAIAQQQGCAVDPRQVESVARFVADNELLQTDSGTLSAKLAAASPMQKRLVQLQQSLFWRRPLFVPELSSRLLLPLARCTGQPWFYGLLLLASLIAALSVAQHWPEFIAYFDASWNPVGALSFFACYLLLSLVHELGHASVARHYGIRANSVGVGLIALMPIMFSEITDAWRLPRRARLHISAAGVTFELVLGVFAALAWCLLDDGPLRALTFYLFTTSLFTTLMINANPLMKFDGYYLLSDYSGEKNLQQTANTTLRLWLWSMLLRSHQLPGGRRQGLLVLFGLASLTYRLMVFTLISYAAYQLLFKAAGVIIFLLCLGLLLIIPAYREVVSFLAHLREQRQPQFGDTSPPKEKANTMAPPPGQESHVHQRILQSLRMFRPRVFLSLGILTAVLMIPLPWPVQLPAATFFAQEQKVMAPAGAILQSLPVQRGDTVNAGQLIAQFDNDELAYRIARTRAELTLLKRRQHSDGFAESLDALNGVYLQDLLSKQQLLRTLETEHQQLQVSAKVSGTVDWVLPGLHTNQFLDLNQPFLSIAASDSIRGRAYAETQQATRLNLSERDEPLRGQLFLHGQWQPVPVVVSALEQIASRRIQDPALASAFGGPLQTLADEHRRSAEALHLITFDIAIEASNEGSGEKAIPGTAQRAGHLVLLGEPVSLAHLLARRIAGVLIRESGV
ncbi:biotin/lipoyl-binding protein [Microbulbifer elongatus]|uniref:biotin/lipoyl-binding protein n=1 Tax=Microbulbifer elongatus TaxID=86173 RepID=UPI001CFE32F6|nr:biotin/lipoyl-binding protein [Microbulbifer elongatus]